MAGNVFEGGYNNGPMPGKGMIDNWLNRRNNYKHDARLLNLHYEHQRIQRSAEHQMEMERDLVNHGHSLDFMNTMGEHVSNLSNRKVGVNQQNINGLKISSPSGHTLEMNLGERRSSTPRSTAAAAESSAPMTSEAPSPKSKVATPKSAGKSTKMQSQQPPK